MLSPITNELLQGTAIEGQEHPACELFPANRVVGRLFGLGIGLGLMSLFLDGIGATLWGWSGLGMSALVLLYAGGRVSR